MFHITVKLADAGTAGGAGCPDAGTYTGHAVRYGSVLHIMAISDIKYLYTELWKVSQ